MLEIVAGLIQGKWLLVPSLSVPASFRSKQCRRMPSTSHILLCGRASQAMSTKQWRRHAMRLADYKNSIVFGVSSVSLKINTFWIANVFFAVTRWRQISRRVTTAGVFSVK